MNRYASRKFIVALVGIGVAQWSLFERLIDGGDYKAILLAIVAAYLAGNVAHKAVEKP